MAKKYELISDLYEQISIEVTRDPQTWRLFLKTACRNYKLRFDEQLLLFAQRPDAIAVLEIERWNTAFGRWVNRGAKGIAVFEDSTGKSQRLKYYFDITDTHGTKRSREVPVWKMSDEYQSDVTEALKNTFGTLSDLDSLESVIKESVSNAVDDNIDDYIYNFIRNGTGSEIDYMKPEDAEEIYKRIVTNSVVYMIYERLGMDNLLTDDDFNGIEYFSTPELLNSIGYATGDIARMGLGIISKTIRSTKKEKQQVIQPVINKISDNERSSYNERNHLHNAGRLSDSGSDITDTTGSYSRQMGRDEERISEAASQSNVLQSDDKRSVDAVSRRRGTESTEAGGQTDERNVGNTGADGRIESKRHDEMGTADEQSAQRSAGDSYSADNNERLSNYKPLPSIEEQTAFIEEFKAEVAKASAFSIPNEIINDHLANGSGFRDGKYRIYEQFRKSLSQKENADFLKNEYGIGGGTHAGGVSGYYYDHNAKGICISKGFADNATRINLNWLEVAKRIQLLINNDRYLNTKEKEHYAQWLNEREERQYSEQGLSTSENKDNEKYIYKVGDTVFIGASEYRIMAKDDQQVMLSDANAPLFNKQYDIADFEHKIKENALNEHLKVILSEEESNTSVISETNTTPINDDDYYFNDAERKEVVAVYYNPDAISGGQFVFAHITYELISKAKDVASDTDSFYEYLDENAYTELIDVGTEEYRTVLSEYSDPNPDFIGRNEENMLQLIALAKNEKITYDKNGYHADDLDEGDLIKVDGEIWAVKSVSSYSVSPEENSDDKFRYQLLSRMQSDCNYMLGNGGAGAIRYLDGENVDTHIHNMLELYNSFSDNAKPEWISVEEIEGYREKLTALVAASGKEIQQNSVEKAESQKPEIPSDVDKFYVQPEIEQVTWIYYNPDSAAGGQLVYNYLTYDDIFNAVLKDDPMEYLLENCKQETLDRGSAGFDEAVEEFMTDSEDISSREENYVGKLLALTEPRYAIYQLKDGEELSDYRFTNSEYMQAHGMYADRENYNQVYRGRMQESETLEDIFAKFNVNRPEDFHGHSLSVSDIICVKQNGKITAHFVDSAGFKEVPDFTLSLEERKARRTLTDNLTLLADNQLASDEMDTLADKLFNYEKAQKYSGTSSRWLIGAGMTADKFEDITTRYHNGEDVRAELAKGMYGKLNHIEFFGSKDGIDDVDISATKSEESITFRTNGGFEVTHSWETLGEALITAAKQEYDRHEELDRQFGTQEKTPEIIAEPVHDTADFDEIPNDISDKEQKPVAPAWEQRKKSKVKSFDLHPDVPMSERNNFDLRSNPVEQVGKKERFRRNAEAIKVLKECEFENRFATPEEQLVLSKYVGWGGLPEAFDENNSAWANEFAELYTILSPEEYAAARESTLTAFYTPPDVINAIYKAMEQMGFKEGNLLEPSCGIGNFIGMLPKSMKSTKIYGVEIDTISAGIAQQLYQKSSIAAQGFEEVNVPDSFFDGVIGNVPFGDFKVLDKRYDKYNFLIHDYFFAKSLDKLRPGGIMALVTSKGTMEKTNSSVRKYIAQRAELLGAIRLPNNTFKGNAGTEVVSDILFLQKRDRLVDIERDWVHLDTDENGITMNSYFVQNPEMILGEMKTVSGRFGEEVTCVPFENADLSKLLSEAVANIHGEISEYEVTDELEEEDNSIPANPTVRNFSYTVVDDKIYFRENSRMAPIEVSATAENRIKGMIGIRDCVRNLIELQSEDYPDEEIKAEQAKLNAVYDTYVKKYGHINSRANKSAFGDDSSFALLSALEIIGDEGEFERKADIFFKRTIMPHKPVTQVDTASEALAVSIGEKAIIDMEYMKRLTGKEEDEIFNDLKGVIFLNPLYNGNDDNQVKYFMADEYLSGNVREKLAIAKKFAEADSSFNINIEALGKVQPEDLTASEISVRLGSTWLPIDVVQQFVHEFLNTPAYVKSSIVVHYSQHTGEWSIDGKSYDRSNVKAYNTYGSSRINAYKIIEETLNLKDVRIFDYVEDIDGSRKPVLNKKETAIAQSKQELIKQGFQEWVWSDPQRRERLCKLYNERFNSIRPREYDGSHIVFSGMNPEITLREHQRNAVAHILYGGNTLLAHAVGAGKTFEMVAAAMESKRLGLCNKSLFVVPNHLTEQWAAEFLQLYPSANILVATKKDFETKNRKRFCGRIATGDYDAVIIGHSQFEKIPMSIERQRAYLEQQENEITNGIAELKRNRGENFSIKQLEKAKKAIRQKIEKLNDQSRKDDVVTFEELGVDRLFIDESHYYKNLYLYTKMRNVGGIAQTEAQKSSDLFMKCRYLDELTGGRGTVFATGTPISNSMVELYTIQRYLQYDTLAKNELQHFDAWASTFGETVTAIELTPEGYTLIGR